MATAVIVAIPGPNILIVVNDSITHGFKRSLATIVGIKVGTLLLVILSMAGVAALLKMFSGVYLLIKWLGIGYLVYIGVSQIRMSQRGQNTPTREHTSEKGLFLKGFLVSATNPKGIIFAGAFFPQFIDEKAALLPQMLILCFGFALIATLIEIIYAVLGDAARTLFQTDTFRRLSNRLSGGILILFGIGLAFSKDGE
ncbi:MAG: LysE family translocator [Desulfobacterales bacterium]|nr:LysE family translocator [Desulfobacterales bacterium]